MADDHCSNFDVGQRVRLHFLMPRHKINVNGTFFMQDVRLVRTCRNIRSPRCAVWGN